MEKSEVKKPDILVFLSDQHHALISGYAGDSIVRTPNLDKLASEGTVFDTAYTSCPLCVPSRVSMLTGCLPSKTGIFTNDGAMGGDQATFVHNLAAEGYETVLCGRMHFNGEDQRHGFTKRLVGDITPLIWGRGGSNRKDLGPYVDTLNPKRCLEVVGGGNSPVLEYDRTVIKAALEYLSKSHDKPQFIIVGTYGPHFSYVAPPKLYEYYRDKVALPLSAGQKLKHPALDKKYINVDDNHLLSIRAAYYGMIENMDNQIGEVRDAWKAYLERSSREGLFVYMSDHGDHAGEHSLNGKETFYEGSSRIPMVFEGVNIKMNNRVNSPVSIMDLGPTLLSLINVDAPIFMDGTSLEKQLRYGDENKDRCVVSEYMDQLPDGTIIPSRMVRKEKWKLITYFGFEDHDMLFNLDNDPEELHNMIYQESSIAAELREKLRENWDPKQVIKVYKQKEENFKLLRKWGKVVEVEEAERWKIPEEAKRLPEIY